MFVDINHEHRYIDIWLAKSDLLPQSLVADMLCQYPKYDVTVWHSGTCDLAELTYELLCNNL